MKPFKPPSIVRKTPANVIVIDDEPAPKKRRISDEKVPARYYPSSSSSTSSGRQPLNAVRNPSSNPSSPEDQFESSEIGSTDKYFNALWRKPTAKKHKTWDGDGILRVSGGFAVLLDNETGKVMGKAACTRELVLESMLSIGGKEVEIESVLPREEYLRGKAFLPQPTPAPIAANKPVTLSKPVPASWSCPPKVEVGGASVTEKPTQRPIPRNTLATTSRFKNPVMDSTVLQKRDHSTPTPRHDPASPGALVMKRPSNVPHGKQVVDVVVDPTVAKHLREHQREGVKFLYECVMGFRSFNGQGAILADEMGLGKTLQTIALIWTLLKQNPIHGEDPVIRKAVVVCPVTLINNWRKEFRKWLGSERVGVFVFDNTKTRITDFTRGKSYSVMIVGYEKVRKMAEELQKGYGVDIIIADEGHRLKTTQNKAGVALKSLDTPRRVILSGTPIQNDLSEFFSMADFVNPGVLGTAKSFARQFEDPIVKSRQPGATKKEIEKGEGRSEELGETTAPFILRRTADILSKYLPPKTEYILLCRPTTAQAEVYRQVLTSGIFQAALGSAENHLQLITILKKVCNSPKLLSIDPTVDSEKSSLSTELATNVLPNFHLSNSASCKIRVLDQLLHTIRTDTSEKVVIVSNFTSTLDLLESLLNSLSMPFLRLDGSTAVGKRQELVDRFNRTPPEKCFAFLLSAKAGGMGLNLIGASRLVLFDVDWNPATDAQAMARIHRDGQKRPCIIYRLLMAGALDEKIWQRQVTKIGLASSVIEQKSGSSSFTRDELRDLFRLDDKKGCQTHELIKCECGGRGMSNAAATNTNIVEISSGEDTDDEELVDFPTLMKSSLVDMEAQERRIREREEARALKRRKKLTEGEQGMQSLFSYTHIDTSEFALKDDENMEALVHDGVLLTILKNDEDARRVNFVFARTSGALEKAGDN